MHRPPLRSAYRRGVLAVTGVALVIALAACTPTPAPSPGSTSPSADAGAQPPATPTEAPPALVPDGNAEDNLPIFTAVTQQVWATDQRGSGRAYIDALVAAGFDKALMQVTPDHSTVGNPAETMQFSVRWGEDACLVGQVGPSTGEPVTAVMPQLAEGRCLVGDTRDIDW